MNITFNRGFEVLDDESMSTINGGFNWGTVAGSCVKGALLGVAFGNPFGGCAVSAGIDAGTQIINHH